MTSLMDEFLDSVVYDEPVVNWDIAETREDPDDDWIEKALRDAIDVVKAGTVEGAKKAWLIRRQRQIQDMRARAVATRDAKMLARANAIEQATNRLMQASLVVMHLPMRHDQGSHSHKMFHGTTVAAAKLILSQGLKVSKTNKERTPGKKGVYATNALKSAISYGQNRAQLSNKDTFGVVIFEGGEPDEFSTDWGFARFDRDIPASKIIRIEIRRTKDLALLSTLKSTTVSNEFYVPVLFDGDDYEIVDVADMLEEKHLAGEHDQIDQVMAAKSEPYTVEPISKAESDILLEIAENGAHLDDVFWEQFKVEINRLVQWGYAYFTDTSGGGPGYSQRTVTLTQKGVDALAMWRRETGGRLQSLVANILGGMK